MAPYLNRRKLLQSTVFHRPFTISVSPRFSPNGEAVAPGPAAPTRHVATNGDTARLETRATSGTEAGHSSGEKCALADQARASERFLTRSSRAKFSSHVRGVGAAG